MTNTHLAILATFFALCIFTGCTTAERATLKSDGKAIYAVAKKTALQALLDSLTRTITEAAK
jgi:hypothetical protein